MPVSRTTDRSQLSGLKDLSLQDGPGLEQGEIPALPPELPTPEESHWGFPDSVYLLAAAIYQNTRLEKPAAHRLVSYGKRVGLPLPEAKDYVSQRTAYELAFNALKYQDMLEDIMIDSCFYLSQPMPDDQMSLVVVMLYDFQDRKFLPWESQGEELIQEVRDVESCLLRCKTKLAASLARWRIKNDLLTIDCILPESVRVKQERASSLPIYAWVNTLKSSLDEVSGVLRKEGFLQVNSIGQLEGQTFCQDPHCNDMLVFPAQSKADLYRTKLLSQYQLIIQDKSCSVGPYAVRPLLASEGDVLMAGCPSGLTISHAASLVDPRHASLHSQSKVFVCVGDRLPAQREELQEALTNMACKNVKLLLESFLSLTPGDPRLQRVRVILLTPQCSVSAVSNPVEFILQENGDTDLLQDLSQGAIAQTKLDALVAQQKKSIDHALKFPQVQAVVYSTCSSYPEENEELVMRALEQNRPAQEAKLQPFKPSSSLPVSLLCVDGGEQRTADGPFFRLEPSEQSNGCFLAVLTREPEPEVVESAQEVLARAASKGLLDGIGKKTNQPTRKGNRQASTRQARTAQTRPHATSSSQSRVTEFLHRETQASSSTPTVGHQGLANRGLSPRGRGSKPPQRRPSRTIPSNTTSHPSHYSAPNPITRPSRNSQNRLNNASANASGNVRCLPTPTQPHPPVPPPTAAVPPTPIREFLRPVALTLPPVLFPDYCPTARQIRNPAPLRPRVSPALGYYDWNGSAPQDPLNRSSGSINKVPAVKFLRPWL